MTLRLAMICSAILAFSAMAAAQKLDDYRNPKPLVLAESVYPEEARISGLGGKVSVLVNIDQKGKVTSADGIRGPDWTCRSSRRPDVLALRLAAKEAAIRSTFYPATKNGKPIKVTLWMIFVFPNRWLGDKIEKERAMKEAKDKGLSLPATPITVKGGVVNGKATSLPKPEVPLEARGLYGTTFVQVEVAIDTDGSIISASPNSAYDFLARPTHEAACKSKFTPTLLSGQPVVVTGIITYKFIH